MALCVLLCSAARRCIETLWRRQALLAAAPPWRSGSPRGSACQRSRRTARGRTEFSRAAAVQSDGLAGKRQCCITARWHTLRCLGTYWHALCCRTHRDRVLVKDDVVREACPVEHTAAISTVATRFAFRRASQQMQHRAACSAVLELWSRTSVVGPCDGLAGLDGDGVRVEDQAAGVRAELHVNGVRRQGQAEGGDGHACSSKNSDILGI